MDRARPFVGPASNRKNKNRMLAAIEDALAKAVTELTN
jgi:hypothetical protein